MPQNFTSECGKIPLLICAAPVTDRISPPRNRPRPHAKTLAAQPGAKLRFNGAPRFHEFVLQTDEAHSAWSRRLLENKIVGGIELSRWYPELGNCTLWCATEVVTRERIDRAAQVLAAETVEA